MHPLRNLLHVSSLRTCPRTHVPRAVATKAHAEPPARAPSLASNCRARVTTPSEALGQEGHVASTLPRRPNARSPFLNSPPVRILSRFAPAFAGYPLTRTIDTHHPSPPWNAPLVCVQAPPTHPQPHTRNHTARPRWPQTRQLLLLSTSELNMAMDFPCLSSA